MLGKLTIEALPLYSLVAAGGAGPRQILSRLIENASQTVAGKMSRWTRELLKQGT